MGVALHIMSLPPNVLLSQQTHLDLEVISLSSIACSDPNISSEKVARLYLTSMRKVLTEMGVTIHITFLLPNVLLSQQTHLDLDVISLSSIACSDHNISSEKVARL